MLKVTLVAILVAAGAAAKKKKPPPPKAQPPPAAVEPAPEPEPAKSEPAPEPEPVKPAAAPEPETPAGPATVVPEAPAQPKAASAVETAVPKLVILEISAGGGVDPSVAAALGDAITLEVQRRGYFTATSMKELQTMLGVERQRQLMGCSETASACMSELADAIGARFVMSGSLTRLGDAFQLSLQTIDTTRAQPIGRTVRIAKETSALLAQVPYAVAEATATTLPPPPSKVLPYTLIIGGGVLVLAGGVLGLAALQRDLAVRSELISSDTNMALLRPLGEYQKDASDVRVQKAFALGACIAGVAMIGLGVFLMPPSSPTQVALVPSGNGAAIVGYFP